MKLDLTSLDRAVFQLNQSISYYDSDLAKQDKGVKLQFRMACIQAFEYTYELSYKMLKRYLEMSEATSEIIDSMSFPELIRTGSERGLLKSDWSCWKQYREVRNITAHTYNDSKAEAAFSIIPDFLIEAEYLLQKLKERVANV
ncbi:MAG: nucleotidyltransferase [Alphaproteobacteria bacterium]|jgi:nucleotidyltransferase substrate binding protein (TIGR01987 family)|nr:nucleotidyltransferase [Alphaproteobacteria bacterium]